MPQRRTGGNRENIRHTQLNRAGGFNSRNTAKQYRPPRVIIKDGKVEYHPLDMMRMGATGSPRNTTGCFGDVSTFGVGRFSIVKKTGRPGKNKLRQGQKGRGVKRLNVARNPGLTYIDFSQIDFARRTIQDVVKIRGEILTMSIISNAMGKRVPSIALTALSHMDQHLRASMLPAQWLELQKTDDRRRQSTMGMIRSGHVQAEHLRAMGRKIEKALRVIAAAKRT